MQARRFQIQTYGGGMAGNKIILVSIAVLFFIPLYFMATGSFQDIYGVFSMPPRLIPAHRTLYNYRWIAGLPVLLWAKNTLIVVAGAVVLSLFTCIASGYAFAFFTFPAKKTLWIMLMAGIMVPHMSLIVPLFVTMKKLGLNNTVWAAIFKLTYFPMGMYLSRLFFEGIPKSILESAQIDGANDFSVLFRIVAPMARPVVVTIALFIGIQSLSDFLWQMLQLQKEAAQTLLVGLMRAVMPRGNVNPIGRSFAVSMVLVVPMFAIFLAANKYFVIGMESSIKE
jgi:ABC-type glycerol-3-phosphate transport system permease component